MAAELPLVVRNVDDLGTISSPSEKLDALSFNIASKSHDDFRRFVHAFGSVTPALENVRHVVVCADNIDWTKMASRDFMDAIAVLPNLKSLVWKSSTGAINNNNKIPIPHLTIFLTRCQNLELLSLEGLRFLTSTLREEAQPDGTTSQLSETLTLFCNVLKHHSSLQMFQMVHCQISEVATDTTTNSNNNNESMMPVFVDETLKSLAFVDSLECIEIRVPPIPNDPGRDLLGLCKNGRFCTGAISRLRDLLNHHHHQQQQQVQDPTTRSTFFPKVRLWISEGYQQSDCPQLLLDICNDLSHNTFLQDFRVRSGGDLATSRFITPAVIDAYNELLESGQNTTLTYCELMGRQTKQMDFGCKLNRLGRGELMPRLFEMTQVEFVEDVMLRYIDDLDVLYYWCRLHPLILS